MKTRKKMSIAVTVVDSQVAACGVSNQPSLRAASTACSCRASPHLGWELLHPALVHSFGAIHLVSFTCELLNAFRYVFIFVFVMLCLFVVWYCLPVVSAFPFNEFVATFQEICNSCMSDYPRLHPST